MFQVSGFNVLLKIESFIQVSVSVVFKLQPLTNILQTYTPSLNSFEPLPTQK